MPENEPTPRTKRQNLSDDRDREWAVPPQGISGLTGVEGTLSWGAIDKFSQQSRWSIGTVESDDEINWVPQLGAKLQTPGNGATISTLPATIIWKTSLFLNGAVYLFALCTDGKVYQVSTAGVQVIVGTGFTTSGTVDIDSWQGTQIMLSDSAAQKVFSWNGTVLTTVFTAQPVQFIRVWSGRLWMGFNSTIQWTNANTNNSLAGDSGSYLITDGNCGNPILGFQDFPAGLYVYGSNWWKTISNLVDQGNPAVLTFQQSTLQGTVGPINKWSVILIGATVYFANTAGFWTLNGAQPVQISSPNLNGFFANLDTSSNSSFSSAYGLINSTPCVFWQARYLGDTQVPSSYTVFGYTLGTNLWFRFVQGTIKWVTSMVSSAITNSSPTVWGCDGTNIFQLFTNTTTAITSTYNSKLWDFGSGLDYDSVLSIAITLIITSTTTVTIGQLDESNRVKLTSPVQTFTPSIGQWVNAAGTVGQWVNAVGTAGNWQGSATAVYALAQVDGLGRCRCFALNISVNGIGCSLVGLVISYRSTMAGKGS
jgi:hypothetical protein